MMLFRKILTLMDPFKYSSGYVKKLYGVNEYKNTERESQFISDNCRFIQMILQNIDSIEQFLVFI